MHHQVLCRVPVSHDELGHTFSWRGCNAAAEVKSLVHTPVLLQDLGTELFCLSHPQRAKLIFFSLDYYFFFSWIKENKNERERKPVTHFSFFAETQLPLSQEHDS